MESAMMSLQAPRHLRLLAASRNPKEAKVHRTVRPHSSMGPLTDRRVHCSHSASRECPARSGTPRTNLGEPSCMISPAHPLQHLTACRTRLVEKVRHRRRVGPQTLEPFLSHLKSDSLTSCVLSLRKRNATSTTLKTHTDHRPKAALVSKESKEKKKNGKGKRTHTK